MPKVPAKFIKNLMKKLGSGISESKNAEHEDMIKAMRARQVPNTDDVEKAMSQPTMEATAPAPAKSILESVPNGDIRPEVSSLNKAQAADFVNKYKTTPQPENPFRSQDGTIGPSSQELRDAERLRLQRGGKPQVKDAAAGEALPEDESDAIDSIMKLMKEAKAKKK